MRRYSFLMSLGVLLAGSLAVSSAQHAATITLRSGTQVAGDLIDLGGVGFTISVNGQERQIPAGDVQAIDFGGGDLAVPDAATTLPGGSSLVVLRNGDTLQGEFYDISGTQPLRLTFRTATGERVFNAQDVRRIYMTRVQAEVATPSTPSTPGRGGRMGGGAARTFQVPARGGWVATGITVKQGQVIRIEASGEVRINANDAAIPTGNHRNLFDRQAPMPDVLQGALIGRIVQGRGAGTHFGIGDRLTGPMPASGQLFLAVNDGQRNDNSGEYTVVIVAQ